MHDAVPAPLWTPDGPTNLLDAQNGPMANLGVNTVSVYKAYLDSGGNTSSSRPSSRRSSSRTGWSGCRSRAWAAISTSSSPSSPTSGCRLLDTSATYGVGRWLRAGQRVADDRRAAPDDGRPGPVLPDRTTTLELPGRSPTTRPRRRCSPTPPASSSTSTGPARPSACFPTSVNQYMGGLAGIVRDRRPQSRTIRCNVLQDDPNAPTDEGRAMLENIHDIAPGANLAIRHGRSSASSRLRPEHPGAGNRRARTSSSTTSATASEPMFQDGIIAQAINTVTAAGRDLLQRRRQRRARQRLSLHLPSATGNVTGHRLRHVHEFQPQRRHEPRAADHDRRSPTPLISFEYDQPLPVRGAGRIDRATSRRTSTST